MTLEDCGDCLNAKLWIEDGEYMSEINWNIDSIADMLFTEQMRKIMKIGQFVEYKGFIGSIEYDPEDKIYYGYLLDIDDSVSYHGKTGEELYKHYCEAIDDYIEFKKGIGKDLVCIAK